MDNRQQVPPNTNPGAPGNPNPNQMSNPANRQISLSKEEIKTIQTLIERCLQQYLSKSEVIAALKNQAQIEPQFTELVWNKLEEQNKEFFKAYHMRLKVKDQIQTFNYLVQEQATLLNPRGMYGTPYQGAFNSPSAQLSPHPQSPQNDLKAMEIQIKEELNDESIRETFRTLKPLCVQILDQKFETPEDCSRLSSKIDQLTSALSSLHERGLKACADYLLFPLATLTKFITMKPPNNANESARPSSIVGIDRVLESLLSCLSIVFARAGPWPNRTLIDILQLFLRLLDVDSSLAAKKTTSLMDVHRFLSDDSKIHLLECFAQLFKNYANKNRDNKGLAQVFPSDETANVLLADEMMPSLGYAVFKVLEFAKEKNRDLQLKAIETMREIELAINNIDIIASFLPGIVGAMSAVINGDFKQGQRVFVAAIEVLQHSVCFTLNDKDNAMLIHENVPQNPRDFLSKLFGSQPASDEKKEVNENSEIKEENTSDAANKKKINRIQRNSEWYNKAIPNLGKILSKIFSISNQPVNPNGMRSQSSVALLWRPIAYDNWQVRQSLVTCATQIARHCSKTLKDTLPALIEVVILHLEDDYPQVASTSRESLHVFFAMISNTEDSSKSFSALLSQATANAELRGLLEENFNKVINSLPRLIRDPDDVNKLLTLRLASGYIQLLQKHLKFILGANLNRLSVALFEILEFDIFDVRIVEQRTMTNMLENVTAPSLSLESSDGTLTKNNHSSSEIVSARFRVINAQRNNFKHFRSEDVTRQIIRLCRLLGRYGDPMALADHFVTLAKTHVSSKARKQSVFILNQLALGSAGLGLDNTDNSTINQQEAKELATFILDEYLSRELWNSNEFEVSESSQNPMAKENDYIILSSLLLEGVGYFARVIGASFDDQLRKCLYPILEKLGESSDIISQSAFAALETIAEICNYGSVKELLQKNIDYIVNAISNQLRYGEMNIGSLKVLFGILNFSGQEIVLMLDDILDDLFKGLVGSVTEFRKPLLKILHGIVDIICKEMKNYSKVEKQNNKEDLKSFILEKMKERKEYLAERQKTTENFEQVREFFTDYHKRKQEEEIKPEDQLEEINEGMNKDDDEESLQLVRAGQSVLHDTEKLRIKRQFQFVSNILLTASHYLAAKSPETRVLVLDIMDRGVKALAYDSANLLPTIHKLWEPMKPRFVDEDPRVLARSLTVMEVFSQVSEDFLTRKFSEDLWPFIKKKLQLFDMSTHIGKKYISQLNEASQYTNTQSLNQTLQYSTPVKMQISMLTCLATAAKFVKLFDKDLHDITNTCRFLLSSAQPKELRVKAVELYKHLRARDEDYVWWILSKLSKRNLHEPPKNSYNFLAIDLTYLETENFDPLLKLPIGLAENPFERSYIEIFQ